MALKPLLLSATEQPANQTAILFNVLLFGIKEHGRNLNTTLELYQLFVILGHKHDKLAIS